MEKEIYLLYKLELLKLIEEKYFIQINDEEVENIIYFDDLFKLVVSKVN